MSAHRIPAGERTFEGRYPVTFEVRRPLRFQRRHVVLRLVIALVFSLLLAFAWLIALVYLSVPVAAAMLISRDGGEGYLQSGGRLLLRWMRRLVAFDAYIAFLTDRLSVDVPPEDVLYEVSPGGVPEVRSALLRLAYGLPSGLVLACLGIAAVPTSIVAGAWILVSGNYPGALYRFHLGVVSWGARLLAYHASLTDRYPPFTLSSGSPV